MNTGTLNSRIKASVPGWLFFAPTIVPLLIFTLYPMLEIVRLSFTTYDGVSDPIWKGLDNYRRAFQETDFWRAVTNSFVFTVAKLGIELPLALTVAYTLYHTRRGRGFFSSIFFLPTVISIAVMAPVFTHLFNPSARGIINALFLEVGILENPIRFFMTYVDSMSIAVIVDVWLFFGFNMVFFMAGLSAIPKALYESAYMEGAGKVASFFYITLPMLVPVTLIVLLNAFVGTMKQFDTVYAVTRGMPFGDTEVIFTYIFKSFFYDTVSPDYGYGAALSVIAAIVLAAVTGLFLLVRQRVSASRDW